MTVQFTKVHPLKITGAVRFMLPFLINWKDAITSRELTHRQMFRLIVCPEHANGSALHRRAISGHVGQFVTQSVWGHVASIPFPNKRLTTDGRQKRWRLTVVKWLTQWDENDILVVIRLCLTALGSDRLCRGEESWGGVIAGGLTLLEGMYSYVSDDRLDMNVMIFCSDLVKRWPMNAKFDYGNWRVRIWFRILRLNLPVMTTTL